MSPHKFLTYAAISQSLQVPHQQHTPTHAHTLHSQHVLSDSPSCPTVLTTPASVHHIGMRWTKGFILWKVKVLVPVTTTISTIRTFKHICLINTFIHGWNLQFKCYVLLWKLSSFQSYRVENSWQLFNLLIATVLLSDGCCRFCWKSKIKCSFSRCFRA